MRIRSIRARLTLWYMTLLTVTFIILGSAAYGLLSYSLSREIDKALSGVARVLAERAHGGAAGLIPSEIDEIFRRFFGFSPLERYFQMLDPHGGRESRSPSASSERLPLSGEAVKNAARGIPTFETAQGLERYPVRLITMPVMEAGRPMRLLQVGMSLQSVYETRARFLLIMGALLPVCLCLAGLGGWLLARRALEPVERMAETASRISAEQLAERVEETGVGDELDRLARTLNQMLGRLDAAFTQIRRFTANAAHELQTPLTIMKGELDVTLRSPRGAEEYQAAMKSVMEEIDRISQLVDSLLLLARSEGGVLTMQRELVDITELAEEVFSRFRALAKSHRVDLRFGPIEPVLVLGDRERLGRLLSNLVENAIKYSKPKGSVAISIRSDGPLAVIEVSDTGIGLSDEERTKIFQPFYRAKDARSRKGVGLGLSIAQSVAVAHGGKIEVESAPQQGSIFRVILPTACE